MRYGKQAGFRRGLRSGHVYKGIARELGRACCLHAQPPEGHRENKVLGVGNALSLADERNRKAGMVSENERQSEGLRDGLQAVLAARITDDSESVRD